MNLSRRQFLQCPLSLGAMLWSSCSLRGGESEEAKKSFDLPEGHAVQTLRLAAHQGGVDIVFSAKVVEGVRTPAIKGDYAPEKAFNLMLRGSLLSAIKHEESGAYLIKKQKPMDPNVR